MSGRYASTFKVAKALGVVLLLANWVLTFVGVAGATDVAILRKVPGSWLYGPITVYTPTSFGDTYAIFFPMSEAMPMSGISHAGFGSQIFGDSGACKLRGGARFSDDGVMWSDPAAVHTTYSTGDGPPAYTPDVDLTGLTVSPRALVQFGVLVETDTASTRGFCQAALRVDPHGT